MNTVTEATPSVPPLPHAARLVFHDAHGMTQTLADAPDATLLRPTLLHHLKQWSACGYRVRRDCYGWRVSGVYPRSRERFTLWLRIEANTRAVN